jgi:hypothetical protein
MPTLFKFEPETRISDALGLHSLYAMAEWQNKAPFAYPALLITACWLSGGNDHRWSATEGYQELQSINQGLSELSAL